MSVIKNIKHGPYDIVIIGSGGAGLTAAIFAKEHGLNVAVISKVHPLKSHTVAAQGGINAALGLQSKDDWRWHMHDTIKAGYGLADRSQVSYMCKNASKAIKYLQSLGVQFDLDPSGNITQKVYGGQRQEYGAGPLAKRACYAKDKTGQQIMASLFDAATQLGVEFYNYHFLLDLISQQNQCYGLICLDLEQGTTKSIYAKHTVIATGGYSQIYQTSTSARTCTGDGIAVAAKRGAMLQDMEFVQFHPTAINKIGALITEAARSAGGKLLNSKGERFMQRYAPDVMELATRDIVARAVATEIASTGAVFLDITHLSRSEIQQELPTIFENCQQFLKLDPSQEYIPIAPAAHYTMGGLAADQQCQLIYAGKAGAEQPFKGLYAIGEAACLSVHGAGRLGCNSLLDLIVFGQKVVQDIINNDAVTRQTSALTTDLIEPDLSYIDSILQSKSSNNAANSEPSCEYLKQQLKDIMDQHGGVFRTSDGLEKAIKSLDQLATKQQEVALQLQDVRWNADLLEYIELDNMLLLAKATLTCAHQRTESRGAHYRADYPNEDTSQARHSSYKAIH